MNKEVLPKNTKLPGFKTQDELKAENELKTMKNEKVEQAPVAQPQVKVAEPAPVKQASAPASVPAGLPEDIEDYEYLLKPKQPLLKGWRVFFPYLFAFLYNLLLLVSLALLFLLPIVKLETPLPEGPAFPINLVEMLGMGEKFTGLNSIAEIGYSIVMGSIEGGVTVSGILVAASKMFGFVTMAILLVIMVIWYTLKLVFSLLSLLSLIFKSKRKRVIDNFFFKNTHQFYSLGILDRDYTFIVFLLYAIFLWGFMNIRAILAMVGVENNIINGIVIFKAFENTDVANFGNIVLAIVVGALFLFRIIYKYIVRMLSRKVRKMYVLKKRKHKKHK